MTEARLPGPLRNLTAKVDVPPSKSLTNRALVAAAMAGGGDIENPLDCEDTRLLAEALSTAGWSVDWGERIRVRGRQTPDRETTLWLGNSGTGARLLIGLMAAVPGRTVIDGSPRLRERPMGPLLEALAQLGARIESTDGGLPISIAGDLVEGGSVRIRPEVSSQFVSSLLLAGPLMRDGLEVVVDGELPSKPYVDLTVDVLEAFGVSVDHTAGEPMWRVPAGTPKAARVTIEGDWSAAAFFGAAAAVAGGSVVAGPLSPTSHQGDRAICEILENAGVDVAATKDRVSFQGPATKPVTADLRNTPDLFPALAVVAAMVPESRLSGLDRLKHKESDRLAVMIHNLGLLGCRIQVSGSAVRVESGLEGRTPGMFRVTAANDHRIAMAMAVAALVAGPLELDDPECVTKSFPDFWATWRSLLEQSGWRDEVT